MAVEKDVLEPVSSIPPRDPPPTSVALQRAEERADKEAITRRFHSGSLTLLAVLAVLYTCFLAKSILIPIAVAFVLHAILSPLVKWLRKRLSVPPVASAAVLVVGLLGGIGAMVFYLAEPTASWMEAFPRTSSEISAKLETWRGTMEGVIEASEGVEELAGLNDAPDDAVVIVPAKTDLLRIVIDQTSGFAVAAGLTLMLLFLLLANNGDFLRSVIRILPRIKEKKRAVLIVDGFQDQLSHYLGTIALINVCLAVLVAASMWLLGMPSPVLWGAMAGILNFVPYLGTAVGIIIVAGVSLLSFDSPGQALLPPLAYFLLSAIEGGILTPAVLGKRLLLSPVAVLVWLVLWGWLWGIAGTLLAVPLLVAVKIMCEQIPSLRAVAILLSRDPPASAVKALSTN